MFILILVSIVYDGFSYLFYILLIFYFILFVFQYLFAYFCTIYKFVMEMFKQYCSSDILGLTIKVTEKPDTY